MRTRSPFTRPFRAPLASHQRFALSGTSSHAFAKPAFLTHFLLSPLSWNESNAILANCSHISPLMGKASRSSNGLHRCSPFFSARTNLARWPSSDITSTFRTISSHVHSVFALYPVTSFSHSSGHPLPAYVATSSRPFHSSSLTLSSTRIQSCSRNTEKKIEQLTQWM